MSAQRRRLGQRTGTRTGRPTSNPGQLDWLARETLTQRELREWTEEFRRRTAERQGIDYLPAHVAHPEAVPDFSGTRVRWKHNERERAEMAAELDHLAEGYEPGPEDLLDRDRVSLAGLSDSALHLLEGEELLAYVREHYPQYVIDTRSNHAA